MASARSMGNEAGASAGAAWRSRRRPGLGLLSYRALQSLLRRCGMNRWLELRLHQIIGVAPHDLHPPARLARGLEVREAGGADLDALQQLRPPVGVDYATRFGQAHRAVVACLERRLVAFVWVVRGPARLPASFGCHWQLNGGMAWLYDLYSHPDVLGAVPHLYAYLREHPPGPGVRFYVGQTDFDNRRSHLAHQSLGYQAWAQLWTARCGGWRRHASRALTSRPGMRRWRGYRAGASIPLPLLAPLAGEAANTPRDAEGVRLQCLCGREVVAEGGSLTCTCGRRLGSHEGGVLCLGEPAPYWGEIPQLEMRALLLEAEHHGWQTAARSHLSGGLREYVCAEQRAAFEDLLPLPPGARVLDIGAGWGSIAAPLARRYQVVAVEGVAERARFLELRRRQEGLERLCVIRGELQRTPLALGQFDAVIANGVLEWAALLDFSASPEQVQLRFLDRLRELLAPGGCIYLAIENRIGWPALRGGADHSGLPYTSLLPRPLARWVCAHSRAYRSQFNVGYRTYTYTHRGYVKRFQRAGLAVAQSWVCTQGYNSPEKMVPLDTAAIRFVTSRAPAPHPQARHALRRLAAQAWTWRWVGSDFAFLLRAADDSTPPLAALSARRGHA